MLCLALLSGDAPVVSAVSEYSKCCGVRIQETAVASCSGASLVGLTVNDSEQHTKDADSAVHMRSTMKKGSRSGLKAS